MGCTTQPTATAAAADARAAKGKGIARDGGRETQRFEKQDPETVLAAPLLEAWCDENSLLGEIGKNLNRDTVRFTEKG